MAHGEWYHGGLVFFDNNVQGLDGFCRAVSSTLEDYGFLVDRQSIQPDGQVCISSARMAVHMRLEMQGSQPRLVLTLMTAGMAVVDGDTAQLVLLAILYRILEAQPAQSVEWLDPQTVLPCGQFLGALTKVSPRRIRGRQQVLDADDTRFAPIDETAETISDRYAELHGDAEPDEEALAQAFRATEYPADGEIIDGTEQAENDIRRLAAWGMTGVVTCLSGPVGLSMAAVNLMRGEDFRLNTHVLALTGFLGAFTSTGAMAQVVAVLPV